LKGSGLIAEHRARQGFWRLRDEVRAALYRSCSKTRRSPACVKPCTRPRATRPSAAATVGRSGMAKRPWRSRGSSWCRASPGKTSINCASASRACTTGRAWSTTPASRGSTARRSTASTRPCDGPRAPHRTARPVTVYRLVSKATLEERIVELHHDKRAHTEGVLGEAVKGAGAALCGGIDLAHARRVSRPGRSAG
jgi:hypothetical protein